jgi:hypothetical protein
MAKNMKYMLLYFAFTLSLNLIDFSSIHSLVDVGWISSSVPGVVSRCRAWGNASTFSCVCPKVTAFSILLCSVCGEMLPVL